MNSILDGDNEKFNKLIKDLDNHLSDKEWMFWSHLEGYSKFSDNMIIKYAKYIAWYSRPLYCRKWSIDMIKKFKNDINWTLFIEYGKDYNKENWDEILKLKR